MTENDALKLVLNGNSESCLYFDEYNGLFKRIGMKDYYAVREFCKTEMKMEVKEWLKYKGILKEIERDMRFSPFAADENDDVNMVCTKLLNSNALLGDAILSSDLRRKIHEEARKAFDVINKPEFIRDLNPAEKLVLTVDMIQTVKMKGPEDETSFWEYIRRSYGSAEENQSIDNALRGAISDTLSRFDRFLSDSKQTQAYYTTLMLHALRSVQSMEGLFEILMYFYMQDLEYTYNQHDPAFVSIVDCIAKRWNEDIAQNNDLKVRSKVLSSGLKALFSERKYFMTLYCEQIVKWIDDLILGKNEIPVKTSETARILKEWFDRKNEELFHTEDVLRGGRTFVQSSETAAIYIRYRMEDRKVFIRIPAIRLEGKCNASPRIHVYQGKELIYDAEAEVYGRLTYTIRQTDVALEKTELNFAKGLDIRVEITADDSTIINSKERLKRKYILFGQNGNEISRQSSAEGFVYVLAGEEANIRSDCANIEYFDHSGQLFTVYRDSETDLSIDGEEVFYSSENAQSVHIKKSVAAVSDLCAVYDGDRYELFNRAVTIMVKLPAGKDPRDFRFRLDEQPEITNISGKDEYSFRASAGDSNVHVFRVADFAENRIVMEYRYVVLSGVNVEFCDGKELYTDNGEAVNGKLHMENRSDIVFSGYPDEESNSITLTGTGYPFDLVVTVPFIRASIGDENLFRLPSDVWKERFGENSFIRIDCPKEWICSLGISNAILEKNQSGLYEPGTYLKGHPEGPNIRPLRLLMRCVNAKKKPFITDLTNIHFSESFSSLPLCADGEKLIWNPVGKYIGGSKDEFAVELTLPDGSDNYEYRLPLKNKIVGSRLFTEDAVGEYTCRISLIKKNLFTGEKTVPVCEGTLSVGDPWFLKFKGKTLELTSVRCYDAMNARTVEVNLRSGAGHLDRIHFAGYSMPDDGFFDEMPCFTATLSYYDARRDVWQPMNSTWSEYYELINPVTFWKDPDNQKLYLCSREGYNLLINRKSISFVNRRLSTEDERENGLSALEYYYVEDGNV